ncbi:hypothetical protein BD311DRAFT_321976 [Dichomitus squalens]|uniref:Uncharacterized protein n=1 Tax=Dichomitus squalens TaxID=114155 RepID=A0A4Q9MQM3_9APHY|nr:hypothetical protein BD311DRAFT_321976 [Dichomitus squalens]
MRPLPQGSRECSPSDVTMKRMHTPRSITPGGPFSASFIIWHQCESMGNLGAAWSRPLRNGADYLLHSLDPRGLHKSRKHDALTRVAGIACMLGRKWCVSEHVNTVGPNDMMPQVGRVDAVGRSEHTDKRSSDGIIRERYGRRHEAIGDLGYGCGAQAEHLIAVSLSKLPQLPHKRRLPCFPIAECWASRSQSPTYGKG